VRRGIAVVVCTAITATLGAGPAHAEVVLAHAHPTPINAYAGSVIWSTYDRAISRLRLTAFTAGVVQTLPVRTSAGPFDADLGPDASGQLTAVYSRCRHRPYTYPWYGLDAPRGCDLYRYSFATRREQKIRAFSSPTASEFLPAIWGNRIAFARTDVARSA
jgi:hypothetical protein